MGYINTQFDKAKGSSDTRMSDHIERKTHPKNADPTRTHLNRELVEFPDGITDRNEAISHRIRTAGIKRKITPDQVRVIRIILSSTHEDLTAVEQNGRLDEWCSDNLQWLNSTFGRENVVSAVLHMDEHTPHIHATVVPIVQGERRKAKKEQDNSKRKYRKKANPVRLCADDVLTREKLVMYHDSYAEAMGKYGLQRGVRGSEARHITTAQYYRDLKRQKDVLESDIQELQERKSEVQDELKQVKGEIRTDRLKSVTADTATAIASSVGSLFGSGKMKSLEQENMGLKNELSEKDHTIESLQKQLSKQEQVHSRKMFESEAKHVKEIADLKKSHYKKISQFQRVLQKAVSWFPMLPELLRIEKLCKFVGFSPEQTTAMMSGKAIRYNGTLYSEQHKRHFKADNVEAEIISEKINGETKLDILINKNLISNWFDIQLKQFVKMIRYKI